jgi:hypothetical protein
MPKNVRPPPKKMPTKTRKCQILKITIRMKERPRLFASRNPFKRPREMKKEVNGWSNISIGQEDPIHPAEGAQDAIEGLQKGHC